VATLVGLNAAILVASNAGGAKMIALPFGLAASATVFSYALSFTFTDAISEVFGRRYANLAVRVGFIGLVLSVLFFMVAIAAPPANFWAGQNAYVETLGHAWRILLGGWTSYMVSQHLDVWLFHRIRALTGDRHLWLRNNLSTAVSQFVDSVIFITIAFYGSFPIAGAIFGQYLIKLVIAALDTPVVYFVVHRLRRYLAAEQLAPKKED